jgi:hypothetical protein
MKHRLVLTTAELNALYDWLRSRLATSATSKLSPFIQNEVIYYWILSGLEVRLYRRIRLALPVAAATRPHRLAIDPATALALHGWLAELPAESLAGHHWVTELATFVHQLCTG